MNCPNCIALDNYAAALVKELEDQKAAHVLTQKRLRALQLGVAELQQKLEAATAVAGMWQLLQDDIAAWSDATFGPGSKRLNGIVDHLRREVDELAANTADSTEFADCLMLLIDAARCAGLNTTMLLLASRQKLEVNKLRKWGPIETDGSILHVEPPAAPQPAQVMP